MDFCIGSPSRIKTINPKGKRDRLADWGITWQPSGNIEWLSVAEQSRENGSGLIVGTLLGALRQSEGLSNGDEEVLAEDALASNGSFALILFSKEEVTVVTDAAGGIPVCYGDGPSGPAIGGRVHDVARLAGGRTLDRVSAVDYLMHGSIVHPYTWFENVQRLPPGSVCKITERGLHTHRYWEPTEPDNIYDPCDEREWGRRLHDEVKSSIVNTLEDAGRVRVFFSGGEDSRVVGSLIPDDTECVLTTVLDTQNREYRLARRSAQALGRKFEWIPRPKNYYKSAVRDRIESIGPGWDFRHTHFLGDIQQTFQDADALVGGYLADTLFKTYHMGNVEKRRGLKPDSLKRPDPDEIDVLKKGEQQSGWFSKPLVKKVRKRRVDHHHTLKEIRPITAGNWHALWPISNALAFAQYLGEHRIGPQVVEPFLFSQVYRLAAVMPDQCREGETAFHHAFNKELGVAGWLPVNAGVPRLQGYLGQFVAKVIGRVRTLKRYVSPPEGTEGPWTPNHFGWFPVVPEDHVGETDAKRLKHRLDNLLAEGVTPTSFLNGGEPSSETAVRALALALALALED